MAEYAIVRMWGKKKNEETGTAIRAKSGAPMRIPSGSWEEVEDGRTRAVY